MSPLDIDLPNSPLDLALSGKRTSCSPSRSVEASLSSRRYHAPENLGTVQLDRERNQVYVAGTLVAARLSGFGFVLQQHAAQQVRNSQFLRLGLIARLVHNRRWLAGLAVMVAGYLVAAWTLGPLDLSVAH